MPKTKLYLIAAIAWLTILTVLLTIPGSSLPKANWFHAVYLDKWVHIGMFAILVVLWCRAMKKRTTTIFLRIAIGGIVYGITMEFVQKYFIPNRSFEFWDIMSDAAGSLLGFVFSLRRYIKK